LLVVSVLAREPVFGVMGGPIKMVRFLNFVLYQVGWFACVLGAAWCVPWTGMSIALLLVGVHLWLAEDRAAQLKLALLAAAVGMVIDTAQLWAGVFSFHQGVVVQWLPPPWMSVLWMQFATTFHYSMNWLSARYLLCASFGLGGAPLAFFAGERLGAIEFLSPRLPHYGVLALLWSVAVPSLVLASDLLGRDKSSPASYRLLRRSSLPQ
jgi:hypothetical protein